MGMPGMMGWSKLSWLYRDHLNFGMFDQSLGLSILQEKADASKKVSLEIEASARETKMTSGSKRSSSVTLWFELQVFPAKKCQTMPICQAMDKTQKVQKCSCSDIKVPQFTDHISVDYSAFCQLFSLTPQPVRVKKLACFCTFIFQTSLVFLSFLHCKVDTDM